MVTKTLPTCYGKTVMSTALEQFEGDAIMVGCRGSQLTIFEVGGERSASACGVNLAGGARKGATDGISAIVPKEESADTNLFHDPHTQTDQTSVTT